MGTVGAILGGLLEVVALVCWIIILIDAFKNEVWKGILSFFCGLYMLYYAIAEYQAENKWLIIAGWLGAGVIGGVLLAGGMAASGLQSRPPLP